MSRAYCGLSSGRSFSLLLSLLLHLFWRKLFGTFFNVSIGLSRGDGILTPKGYEWLYTKPRIFHRDISLNNMMFRKKDGKIFGVLNDFDLALFRTNTTQSSKDRTGTKPFMAIDLLGNPTDVHRYRHDLESLFYVIVYVTSRYHNGQEIDNPPLQDWVDLGEVALKAVKRGFFSDPLPPTSPFYANFDVCIGKMRKALLQGRSAHADHTEELRQAERAASTLLAFDLETSCGHLSFKTFQAILDGTVA
jgi:serine/threonine protein kinase